MKQTSTTLSVNTKGAGFSDITREVEDFVAHSHIGDGVLTLFVRHTSASLIIQENADPDVLKDLADFFLRLVPRNHPYKHDTEGPDDMPSHIRATLTAVSLSIPVMGGSLFLGTWQAIYLFEHRDAPQERTVALHLIGE